MKLSQMELVSAIFAEMDRQCPGAPMPANRVMNRVCECATAIVREAETEFRPAKKGMGLIAWLHCDDTGLSSCFMAHILFGGPRCELSYPHDAGDLGRCERLLLACGNPPSEKWDELSKFEGWKEAVEKLKGLSIE